jgi:hypothetical protein
LKKQAINYLKINYDSIKDVVDVYHDEFTPEDIHILLEYGMINQQQLEELLTIISKPMYTVQNFYQKDNGYYRQQGPLTGTQTLNDIKQ